MFLQVNIKEGKMISGREKLAQFVNGCPDGIYSIRISYASRPKSVLECRRHYFFICSLISNEGQTGYKTKEIHQLFKDNVLTKLPNIHEYIDSENIYKYIDFTMKGPIITYSTKMLNLDGWYAYLEGIKQYSKENLDFLI